MKSICKGQKEKSLQCYHHYALQRKITGWLRKNKAVENWVCFYFLSLMYHYLLFTILCNLVRFAIPYLKNVFTECHTDAEWQYQSERNLIQLLSLKATAQTSKTNTSHILTSRITEIITPNTGELTMSKAAVQLRNLGPIALQSHLKPEKLLQEVFHGNCY